MDFALWQIYNPTDIHTHAQTYTHMHIHSQRHMHILYINKYTHTQADTLCLSHAYPTDTPVYKRDVSSQDGGTVLSVFCVLLSGTLRLGQRSCEVRTFYFSYATVVLFY